VGETASSPAGPLTLHSEARGPHWVAWMTAGTDTRPVRDIVVVGETREEAESRARAWAEQAASRGYL
jgi:hypothetical protein